MVSQSPRTLSRLDVMIWGAPQIWYEPIGLAHHAWGHHYRFTTYTTYSSMHLGVQLVLGYWGRLGLLSWSKLRALSGGSHLDGATFSITFVARLGRLDHYGLSLGRHYLSSSCLCVWPFDNYSWMDIEIFNGPTGLKIVWRTQGLIS